MIKDFTCGVCGKEYAQGQVHASCKKCDIELCEHCAPIINEHYTRTGRDINRCIKCTRPNFLHKQDENGKVITTSFDSLALGAKFMYIGGDQVWVKINKFLIASWNDREVINPQNQEVKNFASDHESGVNLPVVFANDLGDTKFNAIVHQFETFNKFHGKPMVARSYAD